MPELHLKHPGFTFSAYEPFFKYYERIYEIDRAYEIAEVRIW